MPSHPPRECAHCGRQLPPHEGGWVRKEGWREGVDLCHPDNPALPDCYHLVTVYNETVGERR